MDIIRFYRDFGVEHLTEGHKHCRPGYVNVVCPYCTGNPGWHLSWNIQEEYFVCWRCGWHPPLKTFSLLTSLPEYEVKNALPSYGINRTVVYRKEVVKKELLFPTGTKEIGTEHQRYLSNRGFKWKDIVEKWKIQGTGPLSKLDNMYYKFRIIIPFYWNGQVVSFDSRDITGKQQNKYQACPLEREILEHKKILYGNQEYWTDVGICVEGPTDVWRLGPTSFATSGIKYTAAQLKLIATTFKRVAVVYDDESQAQRQAKNLVADLKFRGVDAWNVKIKGDPGGLTDNEAKELVKSILK
jgi:hypothetical protein